MPQYVRVRYMDRRQLISGFGAIAIASLAADPMGARGRTGARGRAPGTLLWQARAGDGDDDSTSSVVAAGDMVYAAANATAVGDCVTYALHAATGRLAWRSPGKSGPLAFAASDGAVYGIRLNDRHPLTEVVALSAASGQPLWTYPLNEVIGDVSQGWLTYSGGTVFVLDEGTDLTGKDSLIALDARTGAHLWSVTLDGLSAQATVADGVVYAATNDRILALDGATGRRRWESSSEGPGAYPACFTDGILCANVVRDVLVSDSSDKAFGLDAASGKQLWAADVASVVLAATTGIAFYASSALGGGTVTFHGLRASTGTPIWARALPPQIGAVLAAANGALYVGDAAGQLTAMAAATGRTVWTHRLAAQVTGIAPAGSTIYASDKHGMVYAVRA
jgi:outer membrane protein assembly factor BamB